MRFQPTPKGRGTSLAPANRFATSVMVPVDGDQLDVEPPHSLVPLESHYEESMAVQRLDTQYLPVESKSIISRNSSPDIPFNYSINPYQGCEHGCIYCYARPTHEYLELNAGQDFETKIFYKTNAVELLRHTLSRPGYRCEPITLGANTDPYQPIESKLRLTRGLLQTALDFKQPICLITKGQGLLRDLDLLEKLAQERLVKVVISVTTLNTQLKNILEPRAAAPALRMKLIQALSQKNIPVNVLIAPVIPAINDMEIEKIVSECASAGALSIGYVLLRLPHQLSELFENWLAQHYPERAHKVISLMKECHGGQVYRAQFGVRQRGSGIYASMIRQRFALAKSRCGMKDRQEAALRTDLFVKTSKNELASRQIDLFNQTPSPFAD